MTAAAIERYVFREDDSPSVDWVVSYRLIWGIPLNCVPTRAEIRLAVWYLLDRGLGVRAIVARTGLGKDVVTGVQDLRKQTRWSTTAGSPERRRRAVRARAARPHWRHLRLLGVVK
jgi:hypothetical protein